jgi:hypothetical protein
LGARCLSLDPSKALAAPSYAMSSSTSTPDEAAFLEWFTSQGGSVHPAVGFKQWEGQGRGCVALQDIEVSPSLPSRLDELPLASAFGGQSPFEGIRAD